MATPRAPKGPQPALGGSDAAFKPFTDAAAASSSKSATAVDISDAKQTKEAAAVKQAVLKAISLQLKDTYRKANPSRPVGCDVAPRRVLTHPSIPVANGCARPASRQTCMPCAGLLRLNAREFIHLAPRPASHLHLATHRKISAAPRTAHARAVPRNSASSMHGTQAPASSRQFCAHHLTLISSPSRSGADNELGDLIVAVSDMIGTPSGERLEILGHLGRGTFGQVLKVRTPADSVFALKVIRNRQAFRRQAETEVELVRWPTAYTCCCGDLKAWGGGRACCDCPPGAVPPSRTQHGRVHFTHFSLSPSSLTRSSSASAYQRRRRAKARQRATRAPSSSSSTITFYTAATYVCSLSRWVSTSFSCCSRISARACRAL